MTELPNGFKELDPIAEQWALPTETQRNKKRLSSSMEELDYVYNAIQGRLEDILVHLGKLTINNLPSAERNLLYLTFSLAEIAPAVELFRQPAVPDGFDSSRFHPADVPNQTPRL